MAAIPRTPDRRRRPVILAVSYASLIAILIFDYMALRVHVGVIAVIPLLFIAYYGRLPIGLATAACSGILLALLDRDEIPGGSVLTLTPIADAISFAVALCAVVLVAERLRLSSTQNAVLREHLLLARTQAEHDPLTGIPNRSYFLQSVSACVKGLKENEYAGVLFADLDRFKEVNDKAGHITGDKVLVHAAERLRHTIRTGDVLARIGGDEFAILICHLHDRTESDALREKIEAQFLSPFSIDGHEFNVGVTIGVSIAPQDGLDPHELLNIADARMYRRKETRSTAGETLPPN